MTDWPLICDECGAKQYIGTLYGGLCQGCHRDGVREALTGPDTNNTSQSGLGDFA